MKTGGSTGSTAVRVYVGAVILAGAVVLGLRLPALRIEQPLLLLTVVAAAVVISASTIKLPIPGGAATLSGAYFTDLLALMLLGPDQAMLVAGASAITQCHAHSHRQPTWYQTAFSASVLIVAMQVTGAVVAALGGFHPSDPIRDLAIATVIAAAVLFLINSLLVAVVVARTRAASVLDTWQRDFLWAAPACLVGGATAAVLFHMASHYLWAVLLPALPLYVTSRAYRLYGARLTEQQGHVQEISALHLASVEALARAIDARDQTIEQVRGGGNHVRRMQGWAVALAQAVGMPDAEIEAVKVASLLHDIGKLAVPEHILTKPGKLTAKEFERVRIHPVVGAEIIKAVPFPYPVAAFIRSHHERWDGTGYPDGLRGEETPLGARVLALVDYFDAISSARPYRPAPTHDEAIAILRSESGRALDPTLVDHFLRILPTLEAAEVHQTSGASPAEPADTREASRVSNSDRTESSAGWVFHNISLATQEMRALYDIAQTLGTRLSVDDMMALLSSKLSRLMPGSSWVLFLHEPDEDVLCCRVATGLAAQALEGMRLPGGEGSSGWAARQRAPVINASAAADFEAAGIAMIEPPLRATLSCPLVHNDVLVGALTIYHVEAESFRDEHRHLLEHISSQVASVLRNAVAFERLRDASFTDSLTRLPNSRALDEFLSKGPLAAGDTHGPHAVIMVDVDGFKAVNDSYGHATGDAALQALAAIMRAQVRDSDFCARCGGDEFVVVLPGCDRAAGESRAADLQQAVADVRVETAHGLLTLGVSVGVSALPEDGPTIASLIAAADERMYLDKAHRRQLLTNAV